MNIQRQKNLEQQHRNTMRDIAETLLRVLVPHEMEDWIGLNYSELIEYTMKALEQEFADVADQGAGDT